jgi:hypothetical protein
MLDQLKKGGGPMEKVNKTNTVFNHVDHQISKFISEGKNLEVIIRELILKIEKFETIISDISKSGMRYIYLYTYIQVGKKRISDLMYAQTLMINYDEYYGYSFMKIFNLIKLRDKIGPDKFLVEIPE